MINFSSLRTIVDQNSAQIVIAIAILLLGIVIGRFLSKLIYKVLLYINLSKILKDSIKLRLPIEEIISYLVKYSIYFISLVISLNQVGISEIVQQTILVLILLMIASILFFAIRDFMPNFLGGLSIHSERLLKVGDSVNIMGIEGTIQQIDMLHIKIINKDKEIFIIPNSVMSKTIIKKRGVEKTKNI